MTSARPTLYGLMNCDSCRAARRWLEQQAIDYEFNDIRQDTPDAQTLRRWLDSVGARKLVNRRSTTWRQLDESRRAAIEKTSSLIVLMQENPTLIKRPVLEAPGSIEVGFSATRYRELFDEKT